MKTHDYKNENEHDSEDDEDGDGDGDGVYDDRHVQSITDDGSDGD